MLRRDTLLGQDAIVSVLAGDVMPLDPSHGGNVPSSVAPNLLLEEETGLRHGNPQRFMLFKCVNRLQPPRIRDLSKSRKKTAPNRESPLLR